MVTISIWADWLPEWTGISAYESQTTEQTGSSTTTQTTIVRGKTLWVYGTVDSACGPGSYCHLVQQANARSLSRKLRRSDCWKRLCRSISIGCQSYHSITTCTRQIKNSDVRFIALARTLNIFQRLDGHRKGMVLSFLYSLDLIRCKMDDNWQIETYPTIGLIGADLSGISVPGGALTSATLKNVYLGNVHLSRANLSGVDLSEAVLAISWLEDADLRDAKLCRANLETAILVGVSFDGADLSGANLKNAVVTPEQLGKAKSLESCVMPNGTLYDSQRPLDEQCELYRERGRITKA